MGPRDSDRELRPPRSNAPDDAQTRSRRAAEADGGQHRPRIDFFVGGHCNNDCVFCNEGGRRGKRRVYTLEDAARVLERTSGVQTVFLTGGEPTLSRDLGAFVDLARGHAIPHIALITNGRRLAREELVRDLLSRGVNEIRVSVHGHEAALHDAHTGVSGSFAQVTAGLENLRRLRSRHSLNLIALVVVTRQNLRALEEMFAWARQSGFDRIGYGIVRPSGKAAERFEDLTPRYAEVGAAFQAFLERRRYLVDPINVDSVPACLIPKQAGFIGARMRLISLGEAGLVHRDEYWEKTKGPPCTHCRLAASCEGVWEGYVARHGWGEFAPVLQTPWEGDAARCIHGRTSEDDNAPLLTLTERCNNGCTAHCGPSGQDLGRVEVLRARLDGFARAGARRVRFGGGEPLLHPELVTLVDTAAQLGLQVTLCSNARMLAYPRLVQRLTGRAEIDLHTALLGDEAGTHDAETRCPGSFAQTLAGLRNARQAGWRVTVALPSEVSPTLAAELGALGCESRVNEP